MVVEDSGREHRARGTGGGQFTGKVGARPSGSVSRPVSVELARVLESAARLQAIVPDATLVGGTAAAYYAGHRFSLDHDHVLPDLAARFEAVLEALEREADFVLNRVTPGKIILGTLGGIETGVRQLIRTRPLEVASVSLRNDATVRVPTEAEILRIKGFLVVKRNQVRDYLDVAALAEHLGIPEAAAALARIDEFYRDDTATAQRAPVRDQLLRQLADPAPADAGVIGQLGAYKGLARRWQDWAEVTGVCRAVASTMLNQVE